MSNLKSSTLVGFLVSLVVLCALGGLGEANATAISKHPVDSVVSPLFERFCESTWVPSLNLTSLFAKYSPSDAGFTMPLLDSLLITGCARFSSSAKQMIGGSAISKTAKNPLTRAELIASVSRFCNSPLVNDVLVSQETNKNPRGKDFAHFIGMLRSAAAFPVLPVTCPQAVLNSWVSQSCTSSGYYSCPLEYDYQFVPLDVEPSESWQYVCAARTTVVLNQHICGSQFIWYNGGCGYNDWGYGCTEFYGCPEDLLS